MTDIITFSPVLAVDANGLPVAAATAEFFESGTTTPITVYADAGESSAHPSPLVADGNGFFPAVFKSGSAVKVVVKTPLGATLYTFDPAVKVAASGSAASAVSFDPTAGVPQDNVQDAIEQIETSIAAKANTASPTLAGTPTAPTAALGTNTTQLATTAFVNAQVIDEDSFTTDSAMRPPSQQSTKAYVDAQVAAVVEWTEVAPVATTSGTAFDVISIPAGVTDIEVYLSKVSLSGSDYYLVQLGDSGGFVTTGYVSRSNVGDVAGLSSVTTGHAIYAANAATLTTVKMRLHHFGGNFWLSEHQGVASTIANSFIAGAGYGTLSGELTQLRLTRSGSNIFDAGSFKVRYR